LASQIKELLGLDIAREPSALLPKLAAIGDAIATFNSRAVAISLVSIALIVGIRHFRPRWPGMLIAVGATAAAVAMLELDVATIGSRFGEMPRTLPLPSLPSFGLAKLLDVFPDALAIALL